MGKLKRAAVFFLLVAFCILPSTVASASSPGSAGDPLVTKSWVDNYIESIFSPLEEEINQLRAQVLPAVNIQLYIGNSTATVNGQSVTIDPERPAVVPQLKTDAAAGGYTMVPVRFIAESLGIDVEWLPDTRQVSFSDGSKTILLTVDSTSATIGSQTYTMGYAPYIENQRTFVHVRFVAEAFDCQVSWDQSAKRVDINR